MSTLRKLLALSTVVILASLTACGGGTTSPPSSSAPASKPPTSQAPASSPIANPPATSAAPKAQVRIGGILADLHQLPFFVAQEKGFLAEEGIELKMAGPFADGPTVMNALQANEIDMGYAGVSVAVTAAARKVEVSIVAGSNNEGTAVIADKSINSVADLKGKTVALPAAGSMQHILMGMLLAKNNMTFNDVNIILGTIKYPDMPGALETGKINAYMAPEPFAAQGVVRGVGKVLTTSAEMWPDHPCWTLFVRKDFAQKNPDIVARVVRAQKKAVDFINKNPEEAKTLAAKFTKLDAKLIDEAMPHVKFVSTVNAEATKRFVKEIITMGETGVIKPIFTSKEVPDIDAFVAGVIDASFLAK